MKKHGPSMYFVSDKNIYDALSQGKITSLALQRLFFNRGIIVSTLTSKQELCRYFSRLGYDYYDQARIGDALEIKPRRDRITSCFIKTDGSLSTFEAVACSFKTELEERGDLVEIKLKDDRLTIGFDYVFVDHKRSELSQIRRQHGEIEVIRSSDGFVMRNTQSAYISELCEAFLANVEASIKKNDEDASTEVLFTVSRVSLETVSDHALRSSFFDLVMNGITGYKLLDVSAAYVYKIYIGDENSMDEDDEVEEIDEVRIERASLKGKGVHRSVEIKALHDRDFFPVRVSWTAIDKSNARFDIDATFASPESCSDFSYILRRVHEEEGKDKAHLRQRAPTRAEREQIYGLIEDAAKKAVMTIIGKDNEH